MLNQAAVTAKDAQTAKADKELHQLHSRIRALEAQATEAIARAEKAEIESAKILRQTKQQSPVRRPSKVRRLSLVKAVSHMQRS